MASAAVNTDGWAGHPRRAVWWLLIVAVHGLLFLAWQSVMRPTSTQVPTAVAWLRLVPQAARAPASNKPTAASPSAASRTAQSVVPRPSPSLSAGPTTEVLAPLHLPEAPPAPMAAAAKASQPGIEPRLLDTEATRRAIRQVAKERSVANQVRQATGEEVQPTAQERLGQAVQRAGLGDCARGEFAGAGMGLLSLPFLVAAELLDKCAK